MYYLLYEKQIGNEYRKCFQIPFSFPIILLLITSCSQNGSIAGTYDLSRSIGITWSITVEYR